MPRISALSLIATPEPFRTFSDAPSAIFIVMIRPAEGVSGERIHLKNVTGLSNVIIFQVESGIITPTQTIERLSQVTIASGDGGLLIMSDGVSNWEIQARVGT